METYLLEECCEILDSQRVPITKENRSKGQYPYYGANGIQDYVDDYIFDDDLVLLAEDGGNFGSKIKPIAYRVSGKCWVNNHAHVLKAKEIVDVDYLCYSLMFYNVEDMINGATRKKLTQSQMRKMKIPKRNLFEQKKIVNILQGIQDVIALKNKQLQKLNDLIQGRFVEMFGDPVSNPFGWDKRSLSKMILNANNGMARRGNDINGNIVLRLVELQQGYVNYSAPNRIILNDKEKEKYCLKENDFLFARVNGNPENVGRCAVFHENDEPIYHNDHIIRVHFDEDKLNGVFVSTLLNSEYGKQQMHAQIKTSAGQYTISQEGIGAIEVILPPISLQERFADLVAQIDKSKLL